MTHSSPFAGLLGDSTIRCAEQTPDALAVRYPNRQWTCAQWDERIGRLAAALRAAGIRRGQRVAFSGKNIAACLELVLATARLGAATVVLNPRLTWNELNDDHFASTVSLICCGAEFRKTVDESARSTGRRIPVLNLDDADHAAAALLDDHQPIGTLPGVHADDTCLIVYPGTTEMTLTQRVLLERSVSALNGIDRIDCVLLAATSRWDIDDFTFGLVGIMAGVPTIVAGAPDAESLVAAITATAGRLLVVPPILAGALAAGPHAVAAFLRMRTRRNSAAPVPPDLLRRAVVAWPGIEFIGSPLAGERA